MGPGLAVGGGGWGWMGDVVVEEAFEIGKRAVFVGWGVSEGRLGLGRRHGRGRVEDRGSWDCRGDEDGHGSTSEGGEAVFAGAKAEAGRAFCAGCCRRARRTERALG